MNTIKKQLIALTLTLNTLIPCSIFGMRALTSLCDSERNFKKFEIPETERKIHEATTPIQHSKFKIWLNRKFSEWYPSSKKQDSIFDNHPFIKPFQDAQKDLGIPENRQLPVIIGEVYDPKAVGAQCGTDLITINKYETVRCSPAYIRFAALHEAAHNKNLDCLKRYPCGYVSLFAFRWFLFIAYGSKYFPVNMVKLFSVFTVLGIDALFSNLFLNQSNKYMYKYQERRADTTAAYATKCHECVEKMALLRPKTSSNDPLQKLGYLSREALNAIAEKLEQAGKKCDYHKIPQHERNNDLEKKNKNIVERMELMTPEQQRTLRMALHYSLQSKQIKDEDLKYIKEKNTGKFFFNFLSIRHALEEEDPRKNCDSSATTESTTATSTQEAAAAARTQQ